MNIALIFTLGIVTLSLATEHMLMKKFPHQHGAKARKYLMAFLLSGLFFLGLASPEQAVAGVAGQVVKVVVRETAEYIGVRGSGFFLKQTQRAGGRLVKEGSSETMQRILIIRRAESGSILHETLGASSPWR